MKVFHGNLDGRHQLLVAAKSKKEAAGLFRTSMYSFNQYCGETGNERDRELALASPGVVFIKPSSPYNAQWEKR